MLRLPPFTYRRPASEGEACAMVADDPDAMFVAGGTDLYPNMKRRQQEPRTVVGLGRVPGLKGISGEPAGGLRLGAMTTLTELAEHPVVNAAYPAVAHAARVISTPLLRNMGTIGGNLLLDTRCNYYDQGYEWRKSINFCMKKDGRICWVAPSSPRCWAVQSSDQAPLMAAIGARVRLVSKEGGERVIPVCDLYRDDGIDYLTKRRDELLTEVLLPPANGWRAAYYKVRRRGSFDFPVLGVGAWVDLEPDGETVREARLRLGAVGSWPLDAEAACETLRGRALGDDAIAEAAERAARPARPLDNTDYHMSWRKRVVAPVVARTLRAVRDGAPGGTSDQLDGVPGLGASLPVVG